MSKRKTVIRALLIAATSLSISAHSLGKESTDHASQRSSLPLPAASDELRAAIAGTPVINVDAMRESAPADLEAWQSLINEMDKPADAAANALAIARNVSVTVDTISGVTVRQVRPAVVAKNNSDRLFVHIHGGAYVFSGGDASVFEAVLIADHLGMPVVSIDYRMPPAHPFPAGLNDVVAVYQELLTDYPAGKIAMGGTSAGGGLTLAAVHKLIRKSLPVPAALFVGTPWADLSKTGDSLYTNEGIDHVLITYDGILAAAARLYAGKHDLKHPLISPVYGSFKGFPPTQLVTGSRDLFLSSTIRSHRQLRAAGVVADLHVYEGFGHGDYFSESPESREVYAELEAFVSERLQ